MTRGVSHPAELRAQVVEAVLAGMTITQAAERFGINKSLVATWVNGSSDVRTQVRTEQHARDEEQTVRELLVDLLSNHVLAIQVVVYWCLNTNILWCDGGPPTWEYHRWPE